MLKKLFILIPSVFCVACTIAPKDVGRYNTALLCDEYSRPGSSNYMAYHIKTELEKRGANQCTSAETLQRRATAAAQSSRQNDADMLNLSTQLLQMGQTRSLAAPVAPAPAIQQQRVCRSAVYGNQLVTRCD